MTLFEFRKLINSILEVPDDLALRNEEIEKVFKIINNDVDVGFTTLITNTFNGHSKRYNLQQLQITYNELNKIKFRKIKRMNTFERFLRDKKRLLRLFKKYDKLEQQEKTDKLKKVLKSEYFRIKRIVNTDSHRLEEETKDLFYNKARKLRNIDKVWECSFKNSRDVHKKLHNKVADKDGYFVFKGYKTKNPGSFGIAKLDINCNCKVRFKVSNT